MTKNSQPDITKSHSNENGKERWDERMFLPIVGEKESERNKEKESESMRLKVDGVNVTSKNVIWTS